jgi:hypothetical protein
MNAHVVNYIRQRELHTAERLMPEPNSFQLDVTIKKLKRTQITKC